MCKSQNMKTKHKVTKLIQEKQTKWKFNCYERLQASQGTTKVYRTKFNFKEFIDI